MKNVVANLGFILQTTGILIALPIIVAFYYQEESSLVSSNSPNGRWKD